MLQLRNPTPYVARLLVLPDTAGVESAVLIVQGTFRLRDGVTSAVQAPLVEADVYVGAPGASPLRDASDLTLAKPGTDVLLDGSAHAPGGHAVPTFCASFMVGPLHKTVRVIGSRHWRRTWIGMRPTAPQPVEAVPLTWVEALGGDDPPRLEHPDHPLLNPHRRPPAWGGCGPVPPSWSPRREHAGTYDRAWQQTRAPFLPVDFAPQFFHVAPLDQQTATPLGGGEPVELVGCRAAGDLRTTLPSRSLSAVFRVNGGEQRPALRLDTVRLLPDADEVRLVWRAVLPLGRRVLALQQVELSDV